MDPVNKDAVKKKFDDRKDKDIDNDGDGFGDDTQPMVSCGLDSGLASVGGDCSDNDVDIHPLIDESCDGIDCIQTACSNIVWLTTKIFANTLKSSPGCSEFDQRLFHNFRILKKRT